jgi:hypothetical protein
MFLPTYFLISKLKLLFNIKNVCITRNVPFNNNFFNLQFVYYNSKCLLIADSSANVYYIASQQAA